VTASADRSLKVWSTEDGHLVRTFSHHLEAVNALAIARSQLPEIDFQYLDVYKPTTAQFDVIFCVEVLEHLLYPDTALHNIVQMLAPNGVALLTVPNGRIDTFEGHINFWSPESWKVLLERNGESCDIDTGLLEEGAHNFAVISKKA